ncbi:MaoC/PaaZ C-terminal domain-containing protein [Actinomycetospora termitidis]|uniref:MaoC/PaaZ C-terminal domain-containing protein n=1 Tax=Actinomycetospora termitidis TaxID=3053470 RepID=A0ABT7M9R9_9PSEU|nr:MaoC/PaaZ C-terminal domain-containing protein [Actinomycetospora sp. Odt1-22]MDL5157396.1 MaoC/PaaZ C-terminal domain-containing protein [Actinomycetospora sp. Odt1-22]
MSSLVGWRVPGGTSRVDGYENLLLHDAVRAPRSPAPHPIWAFLAPQRGMGLSLGELFDVLGTPLDAGPVLGSFAARLHAPLRLGADHTVTGEVTSVVRRASRVLGPFDEVTLVLELRRESPVITATYGFLLPRRDASDPAPSGPTRRREGPEGTAGEPITVRAEEMKLLALLLRDPNPIHLDADAAAALGFGPAVVNQGPANLAYALTHLVRSRPGERLVAFDARFHATVVAGDVVRPVCDATGAFALLGADDRPAVRGHAELVAASGGPDPEGASWDVSRARSP